MNFLTRFFGKNNKKVRTFGLNFGPQHPAAHGVLRLILGLSGEFVFKALAHIGLLHRGTEKLIEEKSVTEALPYFDRLDYVSMMSSEYAAVVSIESLFGLLIDVRIQAIRILFLEITRILNHIMAITTHAMDVGALTPFLWCFEEREVLMELYERISGARLHAAYFRPGGFLRDAGGELIDDVYIFLKNFNSRINEVEELLSSSRIWKQRLVNIGAVTKDSAIEWNLTGVMLRGSGLKIDLRKSRPYEMYKNYSFTAPVGRNGDCFDRYMIRVTEMRQSLRLINQIINNIPHRTIKSALAGVVLPVRNSIKKSMEKIISHFKTQTFATSSSGDKHYISAESPKGEFGTFVSSLWAGFLNRWKIRSPGFFHLQAISFMANRHSIADVVTIIGTQDIVFGEVDR